VVRRHGNEWCAGRDHRVDRLLTFLFSAPGIKPDNEDTCHRILPAHPEADGKHRTNTSGPAVMGSGLV
jgi:hypothetical protein